MDDFKVLDCQLAYRSVESRRDLSRPSVHRTGRGCPKKVIARQCESLKGDSGSADRAR